MASSSNFITYIPQKNLKITDKYLDNQRYGVMSMPALVVNEKVVAMGKVYKPDEVEKLLHKLGF